MLADVASGASQRDNGNSSQPAGLQTGGHPKKGKKKRNRQLQEGTKALEDTMKSTLDKLCNTSEVCECPKSKTLLAEKSDIIRAQSLKIKNLEGVVCALQRQNEEACKQLESLRMLGKKDEATILRRDKKTAMLDAVISKHSIERQALLSKIHCLKCDMKILKASRNAHATDCKHLIKKVEQQDELICSLRKAQVTDYKNLSRS
jgi:chromosome segregation ATPase